MDNTIYVLQYVNMIDGRTFFYYEEFRSMARLEDHVDDKHSDRWTSYEVIVVKR